MLDHEDRLRAVAQTGLLDAQPDAAYTRTVALAAEALATPAAAICVIDQGRHVFVSAVGLAEETAQAGYISIERSIAKYVVTSGQRVIVDDARVDPLLKTHPVVAEGLVTAFLGMPLTSADGHTVGALSVWDTRPRRWSDGDLKTLRDLAAVVRDRMFAST